MKNYKIILLVLAVVIVQIKATLGDIVKNVTQGTTNVAEHVVDNSAEIAGNAVDIVTAPITPKRTMQGDAFKPLYDDSDSDAIDVEQKNESFNNARNDDEDVQRGTSDIPLTFFDDVAE